MTTSTSRKDGMAVPPTGSGPDAGPAVMDALTRFRVLVCVARADPNLSQTERSALENALAGLEKCRPIRRRRARWSRRTISPSSCASSRRARRGSRYTDPHWAWCRLPACARLRSRRCSIASARRSRSPKRRPRWGDESSRESRTRCSRAASSRSTTQLAARPRSGRTSSSTPFSVACSEPSPSPG